MPANIVIPSYDHIRQDGMVRKYMRYQKLMCTRNTHSPQSGQVCLHRRQSSPSFSNVHFPTRYPGQRSSSATPFSASLICRPHPAQVALLHIKHVSFQHIIYEKLIIININRYRTIGEGQETKKVRQKDILFHTQQDDRRHETTAN